MRYFKVHGGKIHLSKNGKETLCGHEIKDLWAQEIEIGKWGVCNVCKKCERIHPRIMEKGKQQTLGVKDE